MLRLAALTLVLCLGTVAFGQAQYTLTDLGTQGYAGSINASGQIAGEVTSRGANYLGFFYDGTIHDLGSLGGDPHQTLAGGINDSGQVVGLAFTSGGHPHAFLYSNGTMQDLGTLPRADTSTSCAQNINASGQVIGWSYTSQGVQHAFLYSNGTMHDLGTLGGIRSYAYGINASGQVVGQADPSGGNNHAFLYSNGAMHDLGMLPGGQEAAAYAINASGQVVGSVYVDPYHTHAFLYDGTMHDLNSLIAPGSGWTITSAGAINDNGQIAATGFNPAVTGGNSEALLLNPIPEPATMGLVAAGLAALVARRRGRK